MNMCETSAKKVTEGQALYTPKMKKNAKNMRVNNEVPCQ